MIIMNINDGKYYLQPAILYKEQIQNEFRKKYYTQDMIYETGCLCNWLPEIKDTNDDNTFQYAIVDSTSDNKLIGYVAFQINWYFSCASNFGVISFDKGNYKIGVALQYIVNQIINDYKLHRMEWYVVCGNPAEKAYDRLCKKYNGYKHIYHDKIKDRQGNYINDAMYEIIF